GCPSATAGRSPLPSQGSTVGDVTPVAPVCAFAQMGVFVPSPGPPPAHALPDFPWDIIGASRDVGTWTFLSGQLLESPGSSSGAFFVRLSVSKSAALNQL